MKNQFVVLALISIGLISCKKNQSVNNDEDLFSQTQTNDFIDFENGSLLTPAAPSPHGEFKLKYNKAFQDAFNGGTELPAGNSAPDGSLIIKDVYKAGKLDLVVVMKKDSKSKFAAEGWVWAEYRPDGSTDYSIEKKGAACISCHSASPNRDLIRTFDLH